MQRIDEKYYIFYKKNMLQFTTIEDAIDKANANMYGLACGLVTKSLDNALYISNELRSGTVWVNCYGAGCPHSPFGGFKVMKRAKIYQYVYLWVKCNCRKLRLHIL